jgi:hypothetical protein
MGWWTILCYNAHAFKSGDVKLEFLMEKPVHLGWGIQKFLSERNCRI